MLNLLQTEALRAIAFNSLLLEKLPPPDRFLCEQGKPSLHPVWPPADCVYSQEA